MSSDGSWLYASFTQATIRPTMARSKSSPPSQLSPSIWSTTYWLLTIWQIEMSNVPPPRSYTSTRCRSSSRPTRNARAAAVGSSTTFSTSSPAAPPASLVAARCRSSKYAGTVMTACVTFSPRASSASSLTCFRIMAEMATGVYATPPSSTFTPRSASSAGGSSASR